MPMPRVHLPILQQFNPPAAVAPDYAGKMTTAIANAIAGNLGHPSKMPGRSYGISAQQCHTGSKLRVIPGSVCSACYAMTDWYRSWRPLLEGHRRRMAGLRHPRWVDAMVKLITGACKEPDNYFRWHDSGDLQGVWHLSSIAAVCALTPGVHHWLPTREYEMVTAFLATGKTLPPNLTVRLSAHMIDASPVLPPELEGFPVSTVSTVSARKGLQIVEGKGSVECRAVEARDNKCGNCRACWEPMVTCVNYPQH
jgi:hypothetical protein